METVVATRRSLVGFSLYLAIFLAIVGVILAFKSLLIAPPYAVSAYLIVFDRESKYARSRNIVVSYLFVIASSEAFTLVLGVTDLALVLNVLVVSVFITVTPYAHPPALALTIFSYIVHDPWSFTVTSLIVLGIVAAADALIDRTPRLRTALARPASPAAGGGPA